MVYQGADLMLFMKKGSDYKSVAYATNHQLQINANTSETSTKDNGGVWESSQVQTLNWEITTENLYGDSENGFGYDDLFDMMVARQPIDVIFTLEGNSTDLANAKLGEVPEGGWTPKAKTGRQGQAIITALSQSASNGDKASFSATLHGVGELKKVPTA